jgi:transcription elongation factor Elf1
VVDWKFEAHCACGHSWWILADVDDPDEVATVECLVCGDTVVDVRPLAEHHRAGGDVE